MNEPRLQRLSRRRSIAVYFLIGFTLCLGVNILWLGHTKYRCCALVGGLIFDTPLYYATYSLLLLAALSGGYLITRKLGWIPYKYHPSLSSTLIAAVLLIGAWNFYEHTNELVAKLSNGYKFPSVLISCLYAILIAVALSIFTGTWYSHITALLVSLLALSPLLIYFSIDLFFYIAPWAGVEPSSQRFEWVKVLELAISVGLQTALSGYWITRGMSSRAKFEVA